MCDRGDTPSRAIPLPRKRSSMVRSAKRWSLGDLRITTQKAGSTIAQMPRTAIKSLASRDSLITLISAAFATKLANAASVRGMARLL